MMHHQQFVDPLEMFRGTCVVTAVYGYSRVKNKIEFTGRAGFKGMNLPRCHRSKPLRQTCWRVLALTANHNIFQHRLNRQDC